MVINLGKGIRTVVDGKQKSVYEVIRTTNTSIGHEASISFNLLKWNCTDEKGKKAQWSAYLIEVNIWGDNSDTAISNSMSIDILTQDEAEAVKIFEETTKSLWLNITK